MKYEVVELKEKVVVGISTKTSNEDAKMGEKIGKLWEDLYQGGVSGAIKNKVNPYAIGLYSDYTNEGYTVTAGHEVSKEENSEYTVKTIPAGKYAKFSVCGNMVTAVAEAWGAIWQMDLDRSYTGDFEEYLNNDFEHAEVDIFVALK